MPKRGTGAYDEEQTCALRALNICDGHNVLSYEDGVPYLCYCDSEHLARDVGWTGAAQGWAKQRSEDLAGWVLHPAGQVRRS